MLTKHRTRGSHVRVRGPWFGKRVDEVWPRGRELVVDLPAAGEIALAPRGCFVEGKQGDDIPGIGVEDLLFGCVGRGADISRIHIGRQILDVREHHVRGPAAVLVILAPPDGRDVGRDACVDDDVFLARVLRDRHAPDDFESVTRVDFAGNLAQGPVQVGERECLL